MCESTEIIYCEKCQGEEVHLMSGSGNKGTCLNCGDQKYLRNYHAKVKAETITHGDRERRV